MTIFKGIIQKKSYS